MTLCASIFLFIKWEEKWWAKAELIPLVFNRKVTQWYKVIIIILSISLFNGFIFNSVTKRHFIHIITFSTAFEARRSKLVGRKLVFEFRNAASFSVFKMLLKLELFKCVRFQMSH